MRAIGRLRRKASLTQTELAGIIQSTQGAISHYETGRRIPDISVAKRLVSAFKGFGVDTNLDEIFSDGEDVNNEQGTLSASVEV